MTPSATLDVERIRANLRVFAARAPVAAVVKADGYRWGAHAIVRALDAVVESFVVADADEFEAIRACTQRPIRLLADVLPERIAGIVARGGIPNASTLDALIAVPRGARVRIGTLEVAGWSGIGRASWESVARLCAERALEVELWTHVTDASDPSPVAQLLAARDCFRAQGADVASIDAAATSAALAEPVFDRVRVGIGLFGAGAPRAALRCALDVHAAVVARYEPGRLACAGYAQVPIPAGDHVTVVRCGYSDGFPRALSGSCGIVSMGMQFSVLAAPERPSEESVPLIGAASDLDALAAHARLSPHEIVTSLARMNDAELPKPNAS